jgi:hypothetical protein
MNQGMIYQRMSQGMIYQRMNQGMSYQRMSQGMIYQRMSQGMIYQMMFNQEKEEAFPNFPVSHFTNVAASLDTPEKTAKQKSTSVNQIRVRMMGSAWIR